MKRKYSMILALLMALALLAAGCSPASTSQESTSAGASAETASAETASAQTAEGGTLLVGLQGDPSSFNSTATVDDFSFVVGENIFNRLVKLDKANNIIPDLATDWTISDDGLTYTFNLAQNVKWHDDTPFTSADVKWTLDTCISQQAYLASALASVDSIETPDDYTVVLKLKNTDAALLSNLSFLGAFILPKHIYEGTDWLTNEANLAPIGTGPFKFVEYEKGVSITLEANDDYFLGAPKVDRVIYKIIPDSNTALQAFLNGELDILGSITPPTAEIASLEANPDVTVVKTTTAGRYYTAFNVTKAPFDKPEVRQAFAYAINREDVLTKAFKDSGAVAEGFYTPTIGWAYNADAKLPDVDIAKAKQLLEQAGYTADANGTYLSVTLTTFNIDPFPDAATVIKDNLKQIGVDVTINLLEQAAWIQQLVVDHDFELTVMGGTVGPDPSVLGARVGTGGMMNVGLYSNAEIDTLFAEALQITDQAQRAEKYKQIQALLAQDLPIIPLVEDVSVDVFKSYITGMPAVEGVGKTASFDYSLVQINQ